MRAAVVASGMDQRQTDAVFEVLAKFEGIVRDVAEGEHDHLTRGRLCKACRAMKVLEDAAETLGTKNSAREN